MKMNDSYKSVGRLLCVAFGMILYCLGHPGNRFSKPRRISTSDSVGKQNRLRQLSTGDDRNNRTPPRGFGGPTTPQYKQGTPNNQRTNVFQSPPPLPPGSAGRMPPTRGMVAQTTVPPPPVGFPPRGNSIKS